MNGHRHRLLLVVGALAAIAFVVVAARRVIDASATRFETAQSAAAMTELDLARLDELRGRRERIAAFAPPESDLIERVVAILGAAGIAVDRFDGLTAEGNAPLGAGAGGTGGAGTGGPTGLRRQSTRITLRAVELADLYLFLDHWRREHPLWVPTRFEITPAITTRTGRAGPIGLPETAVDVQIVLTAVYREVSARRSG